MTYINTADRALFSNLIKETIAVMNDVTDNFFVKGEYFGYFVNRCVRKYLGDPNFTQNAFNSAQFQAPKMKTLTHTADSIAVMLTRSDPIADADKLNYAICAVMWGFLGDAEGTPKIGYGIRAYLEGILDKIKSGLDTVNTGSASDATQAFRRHLVIRGVLSHVMQETYRIKTVPYLYSKLIDNGDLWIDGHLWTNGKLAGE